VRSEYFDDYSESEVAAETLVRNIPQLDGSVNRASSNHGNRSNNNGQQPLGDRHQPNLASRNSPRDARRTGRYSNLEHYLEIGELCPPNKGPAEQLQEEFVSIKESVSSIRLPPYLKVSDSRQGLKRENQAAYNTVIKCAKYAETSLKILSQLPENDRVVRDLVVIQSAQIRYLTEELAALLVSGQFDDSTSKIYRTLQRHNSAFSDDQSLGILRSAVELSAAAARMDHPSTRGFSRNSWRGNSYRNNSFRGGHYRGNSYRGGRGQPNFNSWNNQQSDFNFPMRRPQVPEPSTT
jgi:hypothetical protein